MPPHPTPRKPPSPGERWKLLDRNGHITPRGVAFLDTNGIDLTPEGRDFLQTHGIESDPAALAQEIARETYLRTRRPLGVAMIVTGLGTFQLLISTTLGQALVPSGLEWGLLGVGLFGLAWNAPTVWKGRKRFGADVQA